MGLQRTQIILALLICVLLSCAGTVSAATYSGGSGTSGDPYLLSNDSDIDTLSATSADWDKNFTLTQDITLVGNHTPIGINATIPFSGNFNGSGYAIQNLTIYKTDDYVGFFASIDQDANVHDLGVEASLDGVVSTTGDYVGVLVGFNYRGAISNCYATGNVTSSGSDVGGLVGRTMTGTISNCYATGNVAGRYVGGLVGNIYSGTVSNCYATGNVTGSYAGGLVGMNQGSGIINSSFATGNATGSFVHGLVGFNTGTVNSYCYYSGSPVSGEGTSTSYSNFMNFTFVSGASGLNWNGSSDIITTEDNSSFIWRMTDSYTLPYLQYRDIPYSAGSGTAGDPYIILTDSDIDELSESSADWSSYSLLAQNITLVGNHTPIGNSVTQFTGDFDGNGYVVTNLTVYETTDYAGLFGYAGSSSNIYDLGVETSSYGVVSTGSYVGGLVGRNYGALSNSFAIGNVNSTGASTHYTGGLAGYNSGTVDNCYANSTVMGSGEVGGLIGESNSDVDNCYATGDVTGSGDSVGGLLGKNWDDTSNCYATGNVSGSRYVGGLVGFNLDDVINGFATGTATGSSDVGGLVGNNDGIVTRGFYSGSPANGVGSSTSYSNFMSFTYVSGPTGLNWNVGGTQDVITTEDDSNHVWKIIDGYTLPYHQYQEDPISLAMAESPENITNSTGNFWVNHSWNAGAGDLTDSYNVSYGESWQNGTTNTYFNHTGLSAHAWSNITVYAYNATDSTLSDGASDNVQVPNNEISILNVTNISVIEGETISFDINFTDIDGDTPTFASNNSSLFDSFNTSTGEGLWDAGISDSGTYHIEFNVSDGYGSVDSQVMNITITDVITPVAEFTANTGSGYAPLSVVFTDNSSNTPTSWFWDFGDGTNSTSQNPTHSFSSAGTYSISLNASNFAGSNLSSNMTITVANVASSTSSSSSGTRASVSQGQEPSIVESSVSSVIRVTGGADVNYDFSDSGTPVVGVSFEAQDDEGLVVSKVQVLSEAPEGVPASSGNSYQMMSIDVGSEGTISSDNAGNIRIQFKVSKQWIEENNIDVSTIRMTRYHGDQWNDLSSYQASEDDEYFYFYAETPGFSIFEIVGDEVGEVSEQVPEPEPIVEEETELIEEEEETKDTPGFTVLAWTVVVSLAFLVSRKQK